MVAHCAVQERITEIYNLYNFWSRLYSVQKREYYKELREMYITFYKRRKEYK